MGKNLLTMNLKGGAGKSTVASIVASYLKDATLIEIDKINETASRIDSKEYYKSQQLDFRNENDNGFLEFENMLLNDGVNVIDVGAVMLSIFHNAMSVANLYDLIDVIIIPAMDGKDDFVVAMNFLKTLQNENVDPSKIIFAFGRYNVHEYNTVADQFDIFFDNKELILNNFGIDIENEENYFVIADNLAVKKASRKGIVLREIADNDLDAIIKEQRAERDAEKRLEITKARSLVNNAQIFEEKYIAPAMKKIGLKLSLSAKE